MEKLLKYETALKHIAEHKGINIRGCKHIACMALGYDDEKTGECLDSLMLGPAREDENEVD